jgi:hypothetical protein
MILILEMCIQFGDVLMCVGEFVVDFELAGKLVDHCILDDGRFEDLFEGI